MYSSLAFLTHTHKGGSSSGLLESTCGMVIIRSGNPAPLAAPYDNCFVYEKDPLILNEVTNKPLYTLQKPVQFLTTIMNLYSIQGSGSSMDIVEQVNTWRHVRIIFYGTFI